MLLLRVEICLSFLQLVGSIVLFWSLFFQTGFLVVYFGGDSYSYTLDVV